MKNAKIVVSEMTFSIIKPSTFSLKFIPPRPEFNNNKNESRPPQTVQKVFAEFYSTAEILFWAGSIARGETSSDTPDSDLVIVYKKLPHAYREAFIYEGWLIDAFVHDIQTLLYFFSIS